MDGAQLDVGVGKHSPSEAKQAGEVIVNDDHDAAQAPFHERAKDGFPDLQVLAPVLGEASQDFLFAVTVKADDEVDAGRPETFVLLNFDVLAIEEDGKHVRVDGSGVDELELFDEA